MQVTVVLEADGGLSLTAPVNPGRPVLVGRDEACDLVIADPQVSNCHLQLEAGDTPGNIVVRDLGSTNGTFLDGRRLEGPAIVSSSATIRIGTTTLQLRTEPVPVAQPPSAAPLEPVVPTAPAGPPPAAPPAPAGPVGQWVAPAPPPPAMSRDRVWLIVGAVGFVIAALSAIAAPATVGTWIIVPVGLAMALPALAPDLRRAFGRAWIIPAVLLAGVAALTVLVIALAVTRTSPPEPLGDLFLPASVIAVIAVGILGAIATRGLPLPWLLVSAGTILLGYGLLAWDATGSNSWDRSLGGWIAGVGFGWLATELAMWAFGARPNVAPDAGRGQASRMTRRTGWVVSLGVVVLVTIVGVIPMLSLRTPMQGRAQPVPLVGPGVGTTFTSSADSFPVEVTLVGASRLGEADAGDGPEGVDFVELEVTCHPLRTSASCDASAWTLTANGAPVDEPSGFELADEGETVELTVRFYDVPQGAALVASYKGFFDDAPVFSTTLAPATP